MRVVILQPAYLPWVGVFELIRRSDVFVFYDDVQFRKNSWQNHNRVRIREGWTYLTVPVQHKSTSTIRDIHLLPISTWQRKHRRTLEIAYSRAPYFDWFMPSLIPLFERKWKWLGDLNIYGTKVLAAAMGLDREFRISSELGIQRQPGWSATDRLVEICRHFSATTYLSNSGSREYLDEAKFSKAAIRLEYLDYVHPTYHQCFAPFISHLSAVDLLFNEGPASIKMLSGGGDRSESEVRGATVRG